MNVQIASASEQQLAVAEDVNQNVVNISESGDQILSGSKQNALSSEELAKLAGELQTLMGRFKLTAYNRFIEQLLFSSCISISIDLEI